VANGKIWTYYKHREFWAFLLRLGGAKTGPVLGASGSNLTINGTAMTATAAELSKLAGVVAGTSSASKALVLGANKNTDVLALPVGGLAIGAGAGTAVTASAAEVNVLAGATAGSVVASKAVVAGALSQVQGFGSDTATFTTTGALTASQSGCNVVMNSATSFVLSLPAANALGAGVGIFYRIAMQVATSSGVGHIVRPVGTDVMRATFITTPAAAKGALNTQATSKIGDVLTVFSDGVSAWYATGSGTFTRET